jgi:coenzyme F420 hydrogenase subunit beta
VKEMFKNVSDIVRKNLCTGCGTCYSLCPTESIKIVIDQKKGIYIPQINSECNNCGVCLKVCPGHKFDFEEYNMDIFGKLPDHPLIGNFLTCYLGYTNDQQIRYNSSSGGLVTQILISALEEGLIDGALVTRMKKDDPFVPEPFIAKSPEEIIEAATSKYCPVPANVILKKILATKDEKFAIVGLPCHIHGIRKAERVNKELKEKIALRIGIFCSSVPNFAATKFLLYKYNLEKENVKSISYRGKGWPGALDIQLKEGKLDVPMFEYYNSGFGQYFTPIRCKVCIDQACEMSDLSIADAWIPEIMEKDAKGTSFIVIRNQIAGKFLKHLTSKKIITLEKTDVNCVLKSQDYLFSKKRYINVLKHFKRNVPQYHVKSLDANLKSYITLLFFVVGKCLSKPYLWRLLTYYVSLINILLGGYITAFFRKVKLIK